jgi:hypothetical protein
MRPITKSVTAHHHIATAVAHHMQSGRGGTILVMAGGREAIPALGGAHVAWSELTGLCPARASGVGSSSKSRSAHRSSSSVDVRVSARTPWHAQASPTTVNAVLAGDPHR